jgi:hypothetical protein
MTIGSVASICQGDVAAGHREDDEADRIEDDERDLEPVHQPRHQDGEKGRAAGEREIDGIGDPGQRVMSEKQVAQRAAPERGDAAEEADAEPVHAAPPGRQRRRHALGGDRHQREEMQHGVGRRHAPHLRTPLARNQGRVPSGHRFPIPSAGATCNQSIALPERNCASTGCDGVRTRRLTNG